MSMPMLAPSLDAPAPPVFNMPRRARLILEYDETSHQVTERTHTMSTGWALLEGPWVLWFDDEFEAWQAWPPQNVVCLTWVNE